jgi:hypothetical protein
MCECAFVSQQTPFEPHFEPHFICHSGIQCECKHAASNDTESKTSSRKEKSIEVMVMDLLLVTFSPSIDAFDVLIKSKTSKTKTHFTKQNKEHYIT